ncbi:MAG: sulfatase-like hydrolase/transferase [Myxococcales bacterium]|nr:sulfatase-like hydrolase/transferase [Myxococcales bacterium]
MSNRPSLASAVLSGLGAGAVVGLADGVRVALGAGLSPAGFGRTVALALAVDAIGGGTLGLVCSVWGWVRVWGQAGSPGPVARVGGAAAAGALAAGLGVATLLATATRVNRFLAAGLVVLALGLGFALAAAFGPALARAFSRGAPQADDSDRPAGLSVLGRWLFGPLALGLVSGAAFVIVWRTRAPLRGAALLERGAWVALLGLGGPWFVARAARAGAHVRVGVAGARGVKVAVPGLCLAAAAGLGALRWERDLQFLPWADLIVAALIAAVGVGLHRAGAFRSLRRAGMYAAVGLGLCVPLALASAGSEVARKVLSARGGLVGPALTYGSRALDADRDGYARLLGGGDCNDAEPEINPGALDWPDDGVDQDCDGHDAVFAPLTSPPFHAVPQTVPRDANILLVAIDTLRADRLGAYGYPRNTSAHLDRLAQEGVVFENGWAHAPSTRYSMPALFTGRWPSALSWQDCNACRSWWPRLAPSVRTLGQALKDAGLVTGSLWAYSYFDADERRGFERGIDVYDTRRAALHTNVAGPAESVGSSAREITDDALGFIEAHKDQRFFLSVHYYDPHLSYERHPGAPDFGAAPADLYDREVWFTDQQLGRLFEGLVREGLWERTIVVVTGDHGEGFGERGVVAHGYHLYPPQTKVPFIVRVPGLPPRRVATPVSHVDVAPTLVNLLGAPHEESFLGRSFVDLLAGTPRPEVPIAPVFQEVSYEGDNKKRGIVTETHQLVWNWTPHNTTECYDLAQPNGPDLWGTPAGADVCPALKARLRQWMAWLAVPPDAQAQIAKGVFVEGRKPPPPTLPVHATLGAVVRFKGVDLSNTTVARGESFEVAYHFEVLGKIPEGWKLFFHLNGPSGVFVNLDHPPLAGAFPLERWRQGQTIVDRHVAAVPPHLPPGSYTLYVGLWKGSERMDVVPTAASDGSKRLIVGTLTVN